MIFTNQKIGRLININKMNASSSHQNLVYLGVDVSKNTLDVCFNHQSRSLPNTPAGVVKLRDLITKHRGPVQVVCESTGGYERLMTKALREAEMPISVLNPRLPRDFARAQNRLAKTDSIDAAVLADYGAAMRPAPTPAPDPNVEQLGLLTNQRDFLVEERARHKTRLQQTTDPWLRRQSERLIKVLSDEIKRVERCQGELVKSDENLSRRVERMRQVHGVGQVTALTLCAHMPELGQLTKNQATALAGLAPHNCDSGQRRGQRHISGGRAEVRRVLYMASLTVVRGNAILKAFYEHLLSVGKPTKVVLTAVARKLVILLNFALKNPELSLA